MLRSGETAGRAVSASILATGQYATAAALAAGPGSLDVNDGLVAVCGDDTTWRYVAASTATADGLNLLCMSPSDSPASGRWLRHDAHIDLKLPIAFGTADAATLLTVPVGFRLRVLRAFWEVTVGWTGGASSAIGVSSANAAYNTKGDILGAAGGDVAATLVTATANGFCGTLGAKLASTGLVVLVAADTVRFDRIVSAFTAGTGFAHVHVAQVP